MSMDLVLYIGNVCCNRSKTVVTETFVYRK